jgi:hypothetical protein
MSDTVSRLDGARRGLRVIRKGGRVRWCGRWYRLEDGPLTIAEYAALPSQERTGDKRPRYDGRMDGKIGHFYTYGRHFAEDKVFLHSIGGEPWPGSTCVEGSFCWDTFVPEASR